MFICADCGEIFENPKEYKEYHGFDYGPECYSGCPYCGGAYTETYLCDGCGNWITSETYVEIDNDRYCEDCYTIHHLD